MKLYIPSVGDSILLTSDWQFDLYNEDRNHSLMELFNDKRLIANRWGSRVDMDSIPCTIPSGSVLKVDRIYIRKGQGDFDSITFFWVGNSVPAKVVHETDWSGAPVTRRVSKKQIRFWVKLPCANKIEFMPAP
jgi:hypothetical protein